MLQLPICKLQHLYSTIADEQLIGKCRIQDSWSPLAHLLSQTPSSGFRLQNRTISYYFTSRCCSIFSTATGSLLASDLASITHGEHPHTAFGWTCSKSNTSNIKRRTSGLPYTQYASPCNACWTEVVEGFLRRRLCSNLSCTDSP